MTTHINAIANYYRGLLGGTPRVTKRQIERRFGVTLVHENYGRQDRFTGWYVTTYRDDGDCYFAGRTLADALETVANTESRS